MVGGLLLTGEVVELVVHELSVMYRCEVLAHKNIRNSDIRKADIGWRATITRLAHHDKDDLSTRTNSPLEPAQEAQKGGGLDPSRLLNGAESTPVIHE